VINHGGGFNVILKFCPADREDLRLPMDTSFDYLLKIIAGLSRTFDILSLI